MRKYILFISFIVLVVFFKISQSIDVNTGGVLPQTTINGNLTVRGGNVGIGISATSTQAQILISSGSVLIQSTSIVTTNPIFTIKNAAASNILNVNQNGIFAHGSACSTGYTRAGIGICIDTDGSYALLKSSAVSVGAGWVTITDTTLQASSATVAMIKTRASAQQDGTGEDNEVACFLRQTGGGATATAAASSGDAYNRLANQAATDINTSKVVLNGAKQFDISSSVSQAGMTSGSCDYYLEGWIE